MSPAVPVRHSGLHPDFARIAALSAAISLNATILLLAVRPLPAQCLRLPMRAPVPIRIIPVRPLPAKPPALPDPPPLHPRTVPPLHRIPVPVQIPPVQSTPMSLPGPVAPVRPRASLAPVADVHAPEGPVHAQLAYLHAPPPRYPVAARRAGMQGTVMLRVLVNVQGRPQDVIVARGSGFPLLDRAARRQVLRAWRFQPARVHGLTTPAWALVPVVFRLQRP